jgi:hypothetical protein
MRSMYQVHSIRQLIGRLSASGRAFQRRGLVIALLCVLGSFSTAAGVWAAYQSISRPMPELAAMLPQGALLTIESKDFAGLLKHWNDSKEKTAWLKSDNYSVFSNSRLFGRLGGAQDEFAQAAGLPPDMSFLNEVAGERSIFAWYDIGNLEFLYITQLPSGAAEKTRLMQMRGKFATRQIGGQTFYVRTQEDQSQGQPRTVAFATSGDWLLLATREDLMAGALTLVGNMNSSAQGSDSTSLSSEPWFKDARAAAAHNPGELRMTLNFEKIVPSPYFRSYWVQRNITEMKQYRSAITDLYMETGRFREERVLLSKSPGDTAPPATDLGALTSLLPAHAGVYRAVATPDLDAVLASLNEKLLQHEIGTFNDSSMAPEAEVFVHPTGSAGDLETRIDLSGASSEASTGAGPRARQRKGAELVPLRQLLASSDLKAMMTVSRTGDASSGLWIPFQSAIVLSSARDWDAAAVQSALMAGLQAHLTAGGLGLDWRSVQSKQGIYAEISAIEPLELAVRGKLCVIANDPGLLMEMLEHMAAASNRKFESVQKAKTGADLDPVMDSPAATQLAGFNLPQEQAAFARWSALVDRSPSAASNSADGTSEPAFFSRNVRSLSSVLSALESEHFVERKDGALTRQTVTYGWRH